MDCTHKGWQIALSTVTLSGFGQAINHFSKAKPEMSDFECKVWNGRKVGHILLGILEMIPVLGALISVVDMAVRGHFKDHSAEKKALEDARKEPVYTGL